MAYTAYSIGQRFSGPLKYFPLYDPGTYQFEKSKVTPNKVPFLSTTPRKSGPDVILWTEALYDGTRPRNIQNISSFKFKQKRFPYATFSKEDLKEILCKCGISTPCECPISQQEPNEEKVCQAKVRRRIFKGICPRSALGDDGLSAPSKNDRGFVILDNGSRRRLRKEIKNESPRFYDTKVKEFTTFYQGWKWSKRTSKRSQKPLEDRPGPADYYLEREPTEDELCAEKLRAFKRKTSRQLRFIEIVQQQNMLEGRPGPATYNPTLPKGTDLQHLGSKANRFPSPKNMVHPGPADHFIRREFEPTDRPEKICQAKLPDTACFGTKAKRFIPQREEGPSPATYKIKNMLCQFVHCPTTPFGSSAVRFKSEVLESDDEAVQIDPEQETTSFSLTPTWTFKSKTIRMKPLVKVFNAPSPADLPQNKYKKERSPKSQHIAPFYSSVGRFEIWHNNMPVHGRDNNLEPLFCNMEKAKCLPTFNRGPLYRAQRFPKKKSLSPAPNVYTMPDKMRSILKTYNQRLLDNIKNQHTFTWEKPVEHKSLNFAQRESLLINKCIDLLEPEETYAQKGKRMSKAKIKKIKSYTGADADKDENKEMKDEKNEHNKPKLLRSFLYAHQMPVYW